MDSLLSSGLLVADLSFELRCEGEERVCNKVGVLCLLRGLAVATEQASVEVDQAADFAHVDVHLGQIRLVHSLVQAFLKLWW